MNLSKNIIILSIICLLGGIGGTLVYTSLTDKKQIEVQIPVQIEAQQEDFISVLIDQTHKPVEGVTILPKTTAELQAWFSQATENQVPRVFVEKLPTDFSVNGNKDLYAKVISALILRENEVILTERAVLIFLRDKLQKGLNWTDKEKNFFDALVKKYDSSYKREDYARLTDLMTKVDRIFPMTAVIQSAAATDWGKTNLIAPFQQTGWVNKDTYGYIPYEKLTDAICAYAQEMNGLPTLNAWRYLRENLQLRGYNDIGNRSLNWVEPYLNEDLFYLQQLQTKQEELGYIIPDNLSFLPVQVSFNQKKGNIKTTAGTIPLTLEIADTPEQKAHGLMFRNTLPDKNGMLFLNTSPQEMVFWMKNTFIPLDMIFFDKNKKITHLIQNAEPLSETRRYSNGPVLGVLELPAGSIQKYQIRLGDTVSF
jgi:uncharacterized membrane protein (UPF0127 family)/uncharacterized FlgJ-related protein